VTFINNVTSVRLSNSDERDIPKLMVRFADSDSDERDIPELMVRFADSDSVPMNPTYMISCSASPTLTLKTLILMKTFGTRGDASAASGYATDARGRLFYDGARDSVPYFP
jgi:hypothetical protein